MIDLSWDGTGVRSLFYLAMFLLIVGGVDKLRSIKTPEMDQREQWRGLLS